MQSNLLCYNHNVLFNVLNWNIGFAHTMLAIGGFLLAIMIALILHEWAHAYAAYKSGDPTAKMMGRMTLNPKKHVEPLGLLMFLFVGIGWAKPVPVNPFNYKNFKRGNFWVSIAGVLTNLIIGFVASFALFLLTHFAGNHLLVSAPLWLFALGMFLEFLVMINIALMLFNLLPIPPLDGYNLLRSFTKPNNRYMQFARNNSMILIMIVLVLSILGYGVFVLGGYIIGGFNSLWALIFGSV